MESNDILLSIIMPVYNGEEYVHRAIKSLEIEKYSLQCELIVVDDASTDSTEAICAKWKHLKSVKYIKLNENHGVAFARNIGIERSRGKFLTFLDCDDELFYDAIKIYIKAILKYNVDLIISGYMIVNQVNEIHELKRNYLMGKNEFLNSMLILDLSKKVRYGTLWGKLYKRTIIEKQKKILFEEGILIGEDTWFNIEYYGRSENVLYIKNVTYKHINQNENSLTKQFEKKYIFILFITLEKYVHLFSSAGQKSINGYTVYKFLQLIYRIFNYYVRHGINIVIRKFTLRSKRYVYLRRIM